MWKLQVTCVLLTSLFFLAGYPLTVHADVMVATYNVEDFCPNQGGDACLDTPGEAKEHIETLADLILDQQLDLMCLEEVETSGLEALITELGDSWHATEEENQNGPEPPLDNLIFDDDICFIFNSKFALVRAYLMDEARQGDRLRAPLVATFHCSELNTDITFVGLHCKAMGKGSRKKQDQQYDVIIRECNELRAQQPNVPVIVLGDWNNRYFRRATDPKKEADVEGRFVDWDHVAPDDPNAATFESGSQIDHIVQSGMDPRQFFAEVLSPQYGYSAWAKKSDHFPIVVTIRPQAYNIMEPDVVENENLEDSFR